MYERVKQCAKVNITSGGEANGDPPCPCNGGVVVDVEERHLLLDCVCFMFGLSSFATDMHKEEAR